MIPTLATKVFNIMSSSETSGSELQSLPSYIEAVDLADLLEVGDAKTVVVDVRDDDFFGGNIVGARNLPSERWTDKSVVSDLINDVKNSDTVVFHCMKSQVRGPTCARQFLAQMNEADMERRPTVKVLYGGFSQWRNRYHEDPSKIENDLGGYR